MSIVIPGGIYYCCYTYYGWAGYYYAFGCDYAFWELSIYLISSSSIKLLKSDSI